jgi:hypothetical protein
MLTRDQSPAVSTGAVSGPSPKLLRLLRKRLRQLVRLTLVVAIGLAVAASALAIWWLTSLNRLPGIGDPFDVAALRTFSIPEDRDGFVCFRRANEKRSYFPTWVNGEAASATATWSQADLKVRAWVEANRPALGLFLEGAACPDGMSLRRERERQGFSLAEVAARARMDKTALRRLESGRQLNPTVNTLTRYVRALGKSLTWTVGDDD